VRAASSSGPCPARGGGDDDRVAQRGGAAQSGSEFNQMRVLVTGSNGSLGRIAVTAAQEAGHWVRGLDRASAAGDGVYDRSASEARWHAEPDEFMLGAITDADLLASAMDGIDVVIHLAATPDDLAPFDAPGGIMENNILGVYLVCDAAVKAGVGRLMLTSSVQAIQGLDLSKVITLADGTAPTNHYSLSKVFSESIGEMYARGVQPRFPEAGEAPPNQISVVITRIGWFVRNASESEDLVAAGRFGYYLSHDDAARYFVRVIESQTPLAGESAVLFAVSKAPVGEEMFDMTPARDILGFEAQDVYPQGVPFAAQQRAGAKL
jgi:nucleoside-diphosphate-sugar epimerase